MYFSLEYILNSIEVDLWLKQTLMHILHYITLRHIVKIKVKI